LQAGVLHARSELSPGLSMARYQTTDIREKVFPHFVFVFDQTETKI
jgi:hypothetical protein